ncbi:YtkA-like [Psychrobacillus psychrotolerans]|uniref:YtkA-like n=1 Tax=Psychrobacillus psychrotolerans TaxID=126156 RepID=A0A1I6B9L8_9BACI|nr:FixH family protein [Psychrobacillus psychrotolerans]SFQ77605.1 YtkA-like [Psychrobacillus psychrotolerans]
MKKTLAVLVFATMTLVGCGDKEASESPSTSNNEGTLEEVIVDIQTAETLSVDDVVLSAKVTQSDKSVDDASVEFEVWESGLRDEGHMIEGNLTEDGVYEANYSFDHDGVYYMFAHTNARGLHVMPKQELIVGEPDMSKVLPDDSDNSMSEMNHE